MSASQTIDERYELITRRLQEVLGGDTIKSILAEGRHPKCYWGALYAVSTHPLYEALILTALQVLHQQAAVRKLLY